MAVGVISVHILHALFHVVMELKEEIGFVIILHLLMVGTHVQVHLYKYEPVSRNNVQVLV